MEDTEDLLDRTGFGATHRSDSWWSHPLAVFVGLSLFVLYATARVVYPLFVPEAPGIEAGSLLSPFFSPLFFAIEPGSTHALFGTFPEGWPQLLRSPAVFVLWAPLGLRITCYYYRKAYYRAFFQDPTACAVAEPREDYQGETGLLVFQNLHRYFFYLGVLFIVFLSYDALRALFWDGAIEVHVGTIVLGLNAFLLAGYTFGCHSFRYLVGGRLRCFSCPQHPSNQGVRADGGRTEGGHQTSSRYGLWKAATTLNTNHATWAWFSLFWVAFADFYVWMVAIGVWQDVTLLAL